MATPTFDQTQSKFATPTWSVKINGSPNPLAILTSVELGFGTDVSNAVFTVHADPDTGSFPAFNDSVEIIVNGRTVLKGKIKGISSRVSLSGLTKTFTVISNIAQLMEKVVAPELSHWNAQRNFQNLNLNKVRAPIIISQILGYIPSGTPDEFPGELHLTDQTVLEAVETVIRRLGNYKLYFNYDTDKLEVYAFGQGGNNTRQFIKGTNIIDYNIVDNQQAVVDKVTIIGPPRAIRRKDAVDYENTQILPDADGVSRVSFVINATNVRDILLTGFSRNPPFRTENPDLEVLPSDMGIFPVFPNKFPKWPVFPLAQEYGNVDGDFSFRKGLREIVFFPSVFPLEIIVPGAPIYNDPNSVRVFVSEVPKIYEYEVLSKAIDNKTLGITTPTFGDQTLVSVLTRISWYRGPMRVAYTHDGDRPTASVGSGTIERSVTDEQYQILIDNIPGETFNNEAEILDLMQKRAQAEYDRLHRPKINGTITVIGDENVDLKSVVLFGSNTLDVIKVAHNFTNGFSTQVALTNEPFIAAILAVQPTLGRRQPGTAERTATTSFRIDFQDVEVDKNVTTQRRQEFDRKVRESGTAFAVYQD